MNLSEPRNDLKESIIYILLLKTGKYTFLPELLDIVGKDKMMELLQLFSGMKFQFPTIEEITKYAKEVTIFFRITRANKQQRAMVVKDLADEYFVDEDMINVIYRKMSKLIRQELDIRL